MIVDKALARSGLNLNQFIRSIVETSPGTEQATNSTPTASPSFYFDAFRPTTRVKKSPPKKQCGSFKKNGPISPGDSPGRKRSPRPKRIESVDENIDTNADVEVQMDEQFRSNDHVKEGESYIEVLHRMKEKHEQNLRLIEQMYYADTEEVHQTTQHDDLFSLYGGDIDVLSHRFSVSAAPKKAWTGESTKPAPFSFTKKPDTERKSQMGIARRRCLEYLEEVKQRENAELKKSFKANPIPRSTTEPRFQQMKDHWERRRGESKQFHAWMTQDSDETFSFVKRDEERLKRKEWDREIEEVQSQQFHAKPIPWSVKVSLFERLHTDNEERRKKRIAERAASMLRKSSLPQRMAIYERTKSKKKRLLRNAAQKQRDDIEQRMRKSHNVPDFDKLQAQFQQDLEKARQSKSPTKPIGFSFSARPIKLRSRHDEHDSTPKRTPRYRRDPNPPQPTKKLLDALSHLNAKIEDRKRQEEEAAEAAARLRMDPEKRKILAERIRACMVDNSVELERRQEESLRQAKEQDRQLAKETAERLKEMQNRVDQRPLLLESNGSNSTAKRLARKRALLSVKDSLINAGISDYKKFFDEGELKDLEITDL